METEPALRTLSLQQGTVDRWSGVFRRHTGHRVPLSRNELALLCYLADRPGEAVAREVLLGDVWGMSQRVWSRAVDDTVKRLRVKIERDRRAPDHVLTVHGLGYRFVPLTTQGPSEPSRDPLIELTDRQVDLSGALVRRAGHPAVALTSLEVSVLRVLAASVGTVVSSEELIRRVWGPNHRGGRAPAHTVARLRRKLEPDPGRPRHLLTHRGRGYALRLPEMSTGPRLVGRDDLLRRLGQEVAGVVAIVGPPGVGTSRIAREAAAAWDGVTVDLAGAKVRRAG